MAGFSLSVTHFRKDGGLFSVFSFSFCTRKAAPRKKEVKQRRTKRQTRNIFRCVAFLRFVTNHEDIIKTEAHLFAYEPIGWNASESETLDACGVTCVAVLQNSAFLNLDGVLSRRPNRLKSQDCRMRCSLSTALYNRFSVCLKNRNLTKSTKW